MRWIIPLVAVLALAVSADRGIVEDGASGAKAEGATGDGGIVLVRGNGTTTLAPATCAGGACTRAVPAAATEGLDMKGMTSCRLTVCAPGVQTLRDAGTVEARAYEPRLGVWAHLPTEDKTVDVSDERCQTWGVIRNSHGAARLLYRANGIGTSGDDGGSAVVSLQCCRPGAPATSQQVPGCAP